MGSATFQSQTEVITPASVDAGSGRGTITGIAREEIPTNKWSLSLQKKEAAPFGGPRVISHGVRSSRAHKFKPRSLAEMEADLESSEASSTIAHGSEGHSSHQHGKQLSLDKSSPDKSREEQSGPLGFSARGRQRSMKSSLSTGSMKKPTTASMQVCKRE